MTFLLLLAAAAFVNGVIGGDLRITNVDEFIQFKVNVNNGTNYLGTTVFLDSDLSLAGKSFEPIGNESNYFRGTFDGQGRVINNLIMTSSSQYVGLFGYSKGLTIKNVILDSSCSITSSYSGSSDAFIGEIIGYCWAISGPCTIENNVNMGSVTFSGDLSSGYYSLHLGGIAGGLYSSYSHDITVKNCANYGEVTHSGTSKNPRIGGIVGRSYGSNRVYIYNCLNHGTITYGGTIKMELDLGGIAGYTLETTIENCVSGGKISDHTSSIFLNYIGSIVGYTFSGTSINYCYFTSYLSYYGKYGYSYKTPSVSNTLSYNSTSFELSGAVSIRDYAGTSLIGALNAAADNYTLRDYSRWLLNKENKAVSFTINGRTNPIKMDYQIILLPSLASEGGMSFDGWYTDDGFTSPLTEYEDTNETELYGKYFCLNFTVTLDVNGGDELAVKEMTIGCNRVYGDLPKATRTEYTFLGWFTGRTGRNKVKSGDKVTILSNHTIYAHWLEITPSQVEIVFNATGMSKKEIEEVIEKYTDADFMVTVIENTTNEIRVIVEFIDAEEAKEFKEKVEASGDAKIKEAKLVIDSTRSFSPAHHPMSLLYLV